MNTVMLIYFGVLLAAVATYYLFPKKVRWIVLLFFSCLFSVLISTYMFVFFLATAVSVYCVTNFFFRPLAEGADERAIAKRNRRNRMAIALTVAFNLAILGVLKYYNFSEGCSIRSFPFPVPGFAFLRCSWHCRSAFPFIR